MAIHSSSLAWKIPWTEEPSGLQCIGSPRVRHDGASNTYFFYILFHYGLSKDTEYSFLCYTAYCIIQNVGQKKKLTRSVRY